MAAQAQKREIYAAQDQIKAGKNLDKARQSMANLLKDPANRTNEKIWLTLYDALTGLYEQGNEKLYLKQPYDTAALFNITKAMFETAESLDSVEAAPDRRGRVRTKYRRKHADYLNRIRPNLYNGGTYFIHRRRFADAYAFFNAYIGCAKQPLFREYNYSETDSALPQAAYYAAYCGYMNGDPKATLHHTYWALKDTAHNRFMLQYLADTYRQEGDTARYVSTLREGFGKYATFPFFFSRLIDYYLKVNRPDSAMRVTDRALQADSLNPTFRYAKSTLLLNAGHYDECIAICDALLAKDSLMADAWLNAGLAYFNRAVELDKNVQRHRKYRSRIMADYKAALPYLRRFRELAPNEREKWVLPLYTIYLNLNMGEEFDEIDKLLRNKK